MVKISKNDVIAVPQYIRLFSFLQIFSNMTFTVNKLGVNKKLLQAITQIRFAQNKLFFSNETAESNFFN